MTIYEADWLCPISSSPTRNGKFAVDNGKIVPLPLGEGGRAREARARAERKRDSAQPQETVEALIKGAPGEGHNLVTFPGCAIIPGFVNAHSHLELTILRGFLEDLSFTDWIPRLTRTKYQHLTRDELLASASLGCVEMIRAGVTCLGEVMDLGTAWQAMRQFGLQGIAYQEVFGPAESQADEAIADLQQKIDAYRPAQPDTLRVGVPPHAPYTASRACPRFAIPESQLDWVPTVLPAITLSTCSKRCVPRFSNSAPGPSNSTLSMRSPHSGWPLLAVQSAWDYRNYWGASIPESVLTSS